MSFRDPHTDFKVRGVVHGLQEFTLLGCDVWVAVRVLTDVVVVSPNKISVSRNLLGELSKVQVVTSAHLAKDVI